MFISRYAFLCSPAVPPPDPADFEAEEVTEHQVKLQWDLPVSHEDQEATSFRLQITFPNGSTAHSETLDGSARSAMVNVFPGITYDATLTASNRDGLGQSSTSFTTPPAGTYIHH